MSTTIPPETLVGILARLADANGVVSGRYPGDGGARQPVHTVYGGAHLFTADLAARLGSAALRALEEHAPDAARFAAATEMPADLAGRVYPKIVAKLQSEPVEDFRIDFEDGFGIRPDEEENRYAQASAEHVAAGLAAGTLPFSMGIRIKSLGEETKRRSLRTLDLFLTRLLERSGGRLPPVFVITLPKITAADHVAALAEACNAFERASGLSPGQLRIELMVETTQSILAPDGTAALPALVAAGLGRVTGAHFGTYDYTAACSVTAAHQLMSHPACDFAKHVMQVSLAGTSIRLSDGATNIMPVGPHRDAAVQTLSDAQRAENTAAVHRAWRLHMADIRRSLVGGFYQGWDLHPGQLPTRYAAVYAFFLEGLQPASDRLRNFVEKAARATLVGEVFDDAATGQGLLNYFLRAVNCGALTEWEAAERTGLTLQELGSQSFTRILENRRA